MLKYPNVLMFDSVNPIDTTQFLLGVASTKGGFKQWFIDAEILFCVTEDISQFSYTWGQMLLGKVSLQWLLILVIGLTRILCIGSGGPVEWMNEWSEFYFNNISNINTVLYTENTFLGKHTIIDVLCQTL